MLEKLENVVSYTLRVRLPVRIAQKVEQRSAETGPGSKLILEELEKLRFGHLEHPRDQSQILRAPGPQTGGDDGPGTGQDAGQLP